MAGLAIRFAETLGLHLRNDTSPSEMSDVRKERFSRIWWSLYALERLLEVVTGRPSAIQDREVSTFLPVPIDEEDFPTETDSRRLYDDLPNREPPRSQLPPLGASGGSGPAPQSAMNDRFESPGAWLPRRSGVASTPSTTSSNLTTQSPEAPRPTPASRATYFYLHTQLCRLSHMIADKLYNADTVHQSLATSQQFIIAHSERMESWRSCLPHEFDFTQAQTDQIWIRERLNLGMSYWATVILVRRPGLCLKTDSVPHESKQSKEFGRRTAAACVDAASRLLALLPDDPDPPTLYRLGPWWTILHHLIQAVSVIMLELSFRATHLPESAERILGEAKKAVNWLRAMAENDGAAHRAWELMRQLLTRVAPKVGGSASEVPRSSPHSSSQSPATFDAFAMPNAQAEAYHSWQQGQEQQTMMRAFEAELGMSYSLNSFDPFYGQDAAMPEYNLFQPVAGGTLDPNFHANAAHAAILAGQPALPQAGPTPPYGHDFTEQLAMDFAPGPSTAPGPPAHGYYHHQQ